MDERYKAITVKREDYEQLKNFAEATHRTIAGAVSHILEALTERGKFLRKIEDK